MNHLTELQHTVEELRALAQQLERSVAQIAQPRYETQPQLLHLAESQVKGTCITCPERESFDHSLNEIAPETNDARDSTPSPGQLL